MQWAETALASLLQLADDYVTLDANIRGSAKGPWSVANKGFTPPSGDKRDFTTYRGKVFVCDCYVRSRVLAMRLHHRFSDAAA